MPEKYFDADGNEVEAYTSEEVKELQTKVESAEQLQQTFGSLQKELGLEEGASQEDINKKLAEMKESADPNWQAARTKMDRMAAALKESGKQIDDEGNIIDPGQKPVSQDEINRIAQEEARKAVTQNTIELIKEQQLSNLDADTRAAVENRFEKLSQGEEMTREKTQELLSESMRAVGVAPTGAQRPFAGSYGTAPAAIERKPEGFGGTERGQTVAKNMGFRFAKENTNQ